MVLRSQIFQPGSKFIVTNETKDNAYGPGTTGFISYILGQDVDYPNVFTFASTIIRRGKGGKERIDVVELSTPVFNLDSKKLHDSMPDKERKNYVHIEPKLLPSNVIDLSRTEESKLEYLGWANAYASYVEKLTTISDTNVKVWPKEKDHIVNTISSLNLLNYDEYGDDYKHDLTRVAEMTGFIRSIRSIEATLAKSALFYMYRTACTELEAVKDIKSKKIGPGGVDLSTTIANYAKKKEALHSLYKNYGKHTKVKTKKAGIEMPNFNFGA
jgi:hypothetical protein